uniref:Arrestin C-terminal-like domain-containing protein n=1 Tax=Glossina palpalis gambiensis TaxID=67801 RepID=A0A1B0C6R9_9MUSC
MFSNSKMHLQTDDFEFLSGDTITGTVVLENTDLLHFIELFVAFGSEIIVDWNDLEARTQNGFTVHYDQRFENKLISINAQRSLVRESMEPGNHYYEFSLKIPRATPSSCTAKFGYIKYELSLVLHDTKGFQKLYTLPIHIQRSLNLSLNPKLLRPFCKEFNYNTNWWFLPCLSKPFNATIALNSCAFIPGDQIEYTITVDNASRYFDIEKIDLVLIQKHQFQAERPYKKSRHDIKVLLTTTHNKPCRRLAQCIVTGCLQLPETLPITSQDPTIIMVNYSLHIFIEMRGFNNSSYLRIPIIIGSHNEEIRLMANSALDHVINIADKNGRKNIFN